MSRNISELHPELQRRIALLKQECAKQGLHIGISECVRTPAEQDALYAKGRTVAPIGNKYTVTNCKGSTYSSMHQWGVAADFYRNDGKGAFVDTDGFFGKVGRIGQKLGLEWGGAWKKPVDKPHFQLPDWGSTASRLKSAYGRPDKFRETWEKGLASSAPPSVMDVSKQVIRAVQTWLVEYTGERLTLDGVYGKNTRRAMIKAIQQSIGMPMSGTSTEAMYDRIVLVKIGSTGNLTKCLEGLLFVHGYNPQEFMGNCTEVVANTIGKYQHSVGLQLDKIAGKNTFKSLIQ